MAEHIELVHSTLDFNDGPFGNKVIACIGNTSVPYPNILLKSAIEFPKAIIAAGGTKEMRAHFQIHNSKDSSLSDDEARKLTSRIAQKMREAGFKHCTFKMTSNAGPGTMKSIVSPVIGIKSAFPSFSMDVKIEGKPAVMIGLGAKAFARGDGVNFGKATPSQTALLGHELTHVVQQ